MKRKFVLVGTLTLIVLMLAAIGFAAAQQYFSADLIIPTKLKGTIWYFNTADAGFSGRDVIKSSIVATAFGVDDNVYILKPVLILTTKDYVMLVFCPRSLPGVDCPWAIVTGTLINGDMFEASGPGFTWAGHT
jgi:hypothetical protein